MTDTTLRVIGIGNVYRSDDAVGILIARRLQSMLLEGLNIMEHKGDGATLMDCWESGDRVVLVDAVSSGAKPGSIHRIDAHKQSIPSNLFSCSTHNLGLAEAVELSRSLNRLPRSLAIIGIEGKCFDSGETVSTEVRKSMETVITEIAHLAHPVT